jgi:extracellular factor (EF) 3-hydroxypalmitic acid methyl ester biosynthesis protein
MENLSAMQHENMRKYERKPHSETVKYSVSVLEARNRKWLNLKGKSIDKSEAGICIETDQPLAPGHILWFDGSIEDKAGYVRWCSQFDNQYRVGVELDGTCVDKLDEATDVFNKKLEVIEKRCQNPGEDSDQILQATKNAIGDVLVSCAEFEASVGDMDIIRDARIRFREHTNPILSKSYFINRARTWPQGYQGDYKMLESIYRNTPLSDGIGYYLDLFGLTTDVAEGVRNRLKELGKILRDELSRRHKPSVLNIACGSCREVFELATDIEKSQARFTCIDLDDDALSFAANRLSYTDISPVSSDQIVLRKYNALRMFDHELNMSEFGSQDIIYSVGFFDYLQSDFLATLFRSLYALLNPGGLLITSFKDAARYRPHEYHWITDWDGFLQRTEEDFWTIFHESGFSDSAIAESREESGVIVFYLVKK